MPTNQIEQVFHIYWGAFTSHGWLFVFSLCRHINIHTQFFVPGDYQLHFLFLIQLEDGALKHLQKHCPELTTINMQSCTVRQIFQYMRREIIMPNGFVCMPLCFCNLSCVCLFQQITDEGLVSLCRGCHKLQILCVSGCSNITDASLTAMGLNCPRLKWEKYKNI